MGLWGAPPQRPPGSSPNGNCRNGAILARSKTAPLPVPPSKRMKSPSNIMRQSSLTKLGSMINTAVNKRVGEFYLLVFFVSLLSAFSPAFSSSALCSAQLLRVCEMFARRPAICLFDSKRETRVTRRNIIVSLLRVVDAGRC